MGDEGLSTTISHGLKQVMDGVMVATSVQPHTPGASWWSSGASSPEPGVYHALAAYTNHAFAQARDKPCMCCFSLSSKSIPF